jgi:hypothetical protein
MTDEHAAVRKGVEPYALREIRTGGFGLIFSHFVRPLLSKPYVEPPPHAVGVPPQHPFFPIVPGRQIAILELRCGIVSSQRISRVLDADARQRFC